MQGKERGTTAVARSLVLSLVVDSLSDDDPSWKLRDKLREMESVSGLDSLTLLQFEEESGRVSWNEMLKQPCLKASESFSGVVFDVFMLSGS